MKRVFAVLVVSFLMILMVLAVAMSYLGGPHRLGGLGRTVATVALAVDGVNASSDSSHRAEARLQVGTLEPGDLRLIGYRVQNVGAQPGKLNIVDLAYRGFENGCESGEREAGDLTCEDPGERKGELNHMVLMRLFRDAACDLVLNAGDQFLRSNDLSTLPATLDIELPLAPGEETCLIFAFERTRSGQLTHGALAMGDTLDIDLAFELSP